MSSQSNLSHSKYIQKSLNCSVSVFDKRSKECIGMMMDCSDKTVIMTSAIPLEDDADYEFVLVDVHPDFDDKRFGEIKVHSLSHKKINSSLFGTEFEVLELSDEARKMFSSYSHLH